MHSLGFCAGEMVKQACQVAVIVALAGEHSEGLPDGLSLVVAPRTQG